MRGLVVLAVVAIVLPSAAAAPAVRGFAPLSVAAVGDSGLWVLGSVPCARCTCVAIVRSTDGGRSFSRSAAPQLALTPTNSPQIRFADRRNGFVFSNGVLFATHDAGATWRRVPLEHLAAFAVTHRYAYALTARRLERSAVQTDTWQPHAPPFAAKSVIADLAAYGSSVWLLGTPAAKAPRWHDTLARSVDAGRTFVTRAGPCIPDLGGMLSPASARVVWATCPTGMLGGAWRSTDGGATFTSLRGLRLVNSAVLSAASDRIAVVAPNGAGAPLLRTIDGGRTWTKARTPKRAIDWQPIVFANAKVGAALVQTRSDGTEELWRTTDAGASWSAIRLS